MSVLDPIFDAGDGFLAQARKAVSGSFAAGVGVFSTSIAAGQGVVTSLVAGAAAAVGGLGLVFVTKTNRARRR